MKKNTKKYVFLILGGLVVVSLLPLLMQGAATLAVWDMIFKARVERNIETMRGTLELPIQDFFQNVEERDFIQAVRDGDLAKVQAMADHGANINMQGEYHFTPLYLAVQFRQKEVFGYLLEQGADPYVKLEEIPSKIRRRHALIPICAAKGALIEKDPQYLRLLLEHAAAGHEHEILELFFLSQFRVDDNVRHPASELAALSRNDAVKLKMILEAGILLSDDSWKMKDLLDLAVSFERFPCAELLLAEGAPLTSSSLRSLARWNDCFSTLPPESRERRVGLEDILASLNALDAEILPQVFAAENNRDFETCKRLADEINGKRGIAPPQVEE